MSRAIRLTLVAFTTSRGVLGLDGLKNENDMIDRRFESDQLKLSLYLLYLCFTIARVWFLLSLLLLGRLIMHFTVFFVDFS